MELIAHGHHGSRANRGKSKSTELILNAGMNIGTRQTVAGGAISMIRIASFNVENLFARPKVFDLSDWNAGEPVLKAYEKVSALLQKAKYSATDKIRIRDLLVTLEIYTIDKKTKAIRRNQHTRSSVGVA